MRYPGACLLLLCASCISRSGTRDPAADRADVERAIVRWFDSGLAAGDTAAIRRGLTPTAAILEDSVWYDRDGFVAFVQGLPAVLGGPFTLRYALSDWRTSVLGDVAWTSLRNRAVLTPRSGAPVPLDWRETAVLTRVNGAWLIDRYHSAPVR